MKVNSNPGTGFIPNNTQISNDVIKNTQIKCHGGLKDAFDFHGQDSKQFSILPGGCVIGKQLFSDSENIIDEAMGRASAKYPGAQSRALNGFHGDIQNMTQKQLDDMKDTLVSRMGSEKTSQWERGLLQKMYEITDAVAEHRLPPHVGKIPADRFQIPPGERYKIGPVLPEKPFPFEPDPCYPMPWLDQKPTEIYPIEKRPFIDQLKRPVPADLLVKF